MSKILNRVYARVWLAANKFHVPKYQGQLKQIVQASRNKWVVVFPPGLGWRIQLFQRPQQLALALARQGALVFYIEPVHPSSAKGFHPLGENIYLCHVPVGTFSVLTELYVHAMTWNARFIKHFNQPRIIYDYVDNLDAFEDSRARLESDHRLMMRTAWLVVATAKLLFEEVFEIRSDALLVPNGVDYAHFSPENQKVSWPVPGDLTTILANKKPVIGYHGALARWFDFELFEKVANQREDLNFVLIGPDLDGSLQNSGLLKLQNIYWLGVKTYQQLPAYVASFDVAVIPFKLNEITHATSPIKLYEYLAAGKPVVITPMQESASLNAALSADGADEFCHKLDQALQLRDDLQYLSQLRQIALENTWDKRALQILQALQEGPENLSEK